MSESAPRSPYRPLTLMASLVLVVAALYWGRAVLIPLALAVLLAFLLSPLVRHLQAAGLRRVPAAILVVLAAFVVLGGVGWVVSLQLSQLAAKGPDYEVRVRAKLDGLRAAIKGSVLGKVLGGGAPAPEAPRPAPPPEVPRGAPEKTAPPLRVILEQPPPDPLLQLTAALDPLVHLLGTAGLIVLLVILLLIHREELRNRLLRLAGYGRLTVTTRALDEATQRISYYLMAKSLVNSGFGVAVGVGLLVIGVPYSFLWGFLVAVLRFIPSLGTWLAMLAPMALALAAIDEWEPMLYILVLFAVLELFTTNVVEPWLYGARIGVSSVALVVALAFWTWLWGPVGLILATPLTVCLAVLGKYVPQLEFMNVVMSDRPALEAHVRYYQRLLARDQDEAADVVEAYRAGHTVEEVYDDLLLPALVTARQDHERAHLSEDDERFLLEATGELLEEVRPEPPPAEEDGQPAAVVLGYPVRDAAAEVALRMLGLLLDPRRCQLELAATGTLSSELVGLVEEKQPAVLCVGSLAPGGLAMTRSLLKRLRVRFPELKVVVARLGPSDDPEKARKVLLEAGADYATDTLLETRNQVAQIVQFPDAGAPVAAG